MDGQRCAGLVDHGEQEDATPSWLGPTENRTLAYLGHVMVSGLVDQISGETICNNHAPAEEEEEDSAVRVSAERQARVVQVVGQWSFPAHELSDDELEFAAAVMFKHAFTMSELQRWRIPAGTLRNFVAACRASYNDFVPYHNFRHVVDVLQATFHFLVQIGVLPAFNGSPWRPPPKSAMASLLGPFEALTLLVAAIGHDVGHPGVNNGFLVTLKAPVAQLYNDRSVLESFHCAAYSQILRKHWPAVFNDSKMRQLMISSILATDMALHYEYMKKLGDLQGTLDHQSNGVEEWNPRMVEEHTSLTCALIIKCADISNVAREYKTSLQWMFLLADEFSQQSTMESALEIPSSLMGAPKSELGALAKSQLRFMDLFAIPLFQGMADIVPAMTYCVNQLGVNKNLFKKSVAAAGEAAKVKEETSTTTLMTTTATKNGNSAAGREDGSRVSEAVPCSTCT